VCGICGIINFDNTPQIENLNLMRDEMINRGPDVGGFHPIGDYAFFGHRRLKIIDLSDEANQPMSNEDDTIWTVFNGEIYNFQDLKSDLEKSGHLFKTKSDTEVIIHGYEQWGENLIKKLDGMFAFAIWDSHKNQTLLARDPYGKKPLFYQYENNELRFASEIKALWKTPDKSFQIDPRGLDCYLHHLSPTQEHCIFEGVNKVLPGHYCIFNHSGFSSHLYWKPDFSKKIKRTEKETIDIIENVLKKAVEKRLISDVPLGAFLSGGIDSSLVVAMMATICREPVKTFSIGFEEQDFSELEYAKQVAERYKTDHYEIILKPDILSILPSLVWEYGEPFADSSAVPTYYVSKAAREHVTVALSGDGGDELFGGYDIAKASYYSSMLKSLLPQFAFKKLEDWVFSPKEEKNTSGIIQKLRTLIVHASNNPLHRHSYSLAWNQTFKKQLYTDSFSSSLSGHHPSHIFQKYDEDIKNLSIIDQNLLLTIAGRLPNDYLIKVDVASMKCSLELRSPFLDKELAVLSQSIDPQLKVKGGCQKYLLKKLAERSEQGWDDDLLKFVNDNIHKVIDQF
jgi:asparagine synthase (glutamine-hydrolysing)